MRLLRFGLIATGITVATTAIIMVLLFTLDLGRFKPQVETLLTTLAGRGIHIDGIFQPSLGSEIRILVEDVRVDNPDVFTVDGRRLYILSFHCQNSRRAV
jgi:hypothetical protein